MIKCIQCGAGIGIRDQWCPSCITPRGPRTILETKLLNVDHAQTFAKAALGTLTGSNEDDAIKRAVELLDAVSGRLEAKVEEEAGRQR